MKALFISYNEALNPLMLSQGIPYLKGLSRRGVGCHLLTFEKEPEDRLEYGKKCLALSEELRSFGIQWRRLRYHKRPTLPATIFDIAAGILVSLWLILKERVDIVHGRATVPALMAYVAARLTGRKFLFDERGIMAEEYVDGGLWPRNGFLHLATRAVERRLLRACDALVVLTHSFKDILWDSDYVGWVRGEARPAVRVIPCCVDMAKFTPRGDGRRYRKRWGLEGRYVFMYSGSLGTWYMLEEMLDFFRAAKGIIANAHFLMLVRTEKDLIERRRREKGIASGDLTVDDVGFGEMPDAIAAADSAVFFIKPVFSKKSSCPTKLAEFLACGVPVVINAGVGDSDRIVLEGGAGAVVRSYDEGGYSEAARSVFGLCQDKAGTGRRCVETARRHFDLERGVDQYWDLYRALAGERIPAPRR